MIAADKLPYTRDLDAFTTATFLKVKATSCQNKLINQRIELGKLK